MKRIPLRDRYGQPRDYTLVDDEDYEELMKYRWYSLNGSENKYVVTETRIGDAKGGRIFMHRLIAGTPKGMDTDHVNGNRLDNQRSNLRICSRSENMRNMQRHRKGSLVGTTYHKKANKYQAQAWRDNKSVYLGLYATEALAQQAFTNYESTL